MIVSNKDHKLTLQISMGLFICVAKFIMSCVKLEAKRSSFISLKWIGINTGITKYTYMHTYSEDSISVMLHSIQCNNNGDNNDDNNNNKNTSFGFWFFILGFTIFLVLFVYSREESQPRYVR